MGKISIIAILLVLFLLPIAHATTNNVQYRYSFNSDFTDSTGRNDLATTGGTVSVINSTIFKIENGSVKVNTGLIATGGFNGSIYGTGALLSVPDDISIAAWVNWTATDSPIVTYSGDGGPNFAQWSWRILANGTLSLINRKTNVLNVEYYSTGVNLTPNVWTHVGITQDGAAGFPKFYVNGVLGTSIVAGGAVNNSRPNMNLTFFVGKQIDNTITTFNGFIDELALWHKILTTNDMVALYAAGAGIVYPYSIASDQNFTATYNSSENLAVVTKITMQQNSSDFNYKYALACDITSTTLWNELFNTFYNFTTQNMSTNFVNPESYLTFSGLTWTSVVNVTQNFDMQKNANQAYRDYFLLEFQYQTSTNLYTDFITYDSSNNPGLYLTLNKSGNTLIVGQYYPAFSTNINIANFTLTGGNVNLGIRLTPHHDTGTNTDDFTFTITESNNTGTQTQPNYETIGGVSTIENVEIFTGNHFNGTTSYKRLALSKTSNPTPAFVDFQNGQRENVGGVIVESPPPASSVSGDGFTVIPDFNNVFYSVCQYSNGNSRTQRHFISPTASADDYNNFRDLLVTASQVNTNTSDATEGGAAGPGSGDFGTDIIPSFFDSIGFTSTASKLLIWMLIAFVIAAIGFGVHPILGVLVFIAVIIVGVPIGMVPLWFLLVFIIMAGAVVALLYRMIFSGS